MDRVNQEVATFKQIQQIGPAIRELAWALEDTMLVELGTLTVSNSSLPRFIEAMRRLAADCDKIPGQMLTNSQEALREVDRNVLNIMNIVIANG